MPRHEEGRNFCGMVVAGVAAESPHFQPSMVLPPSVVPTTATPEIIGIRYRRLLPLIAARFVPLPVTPMTPFASTPPPVTNLVTAIVHAAGSAAEALAVFEFCS